MAFILTTFNSCDKTYDDLMTSEVLVGGLIKPLGSFPYKLGGTVDFDVTIEIPKGPGIASIEIYKTYTDKATVLDQTVDVSSANSDVAVTKLLTYNYAALISGLSMSADESVLSIGDAWTFSYKSIMADGRVVSSAATTVIGVANYFAGTYDNSVNYHHPSSGSYPDNGSVTTSEKTLVATSANTCQTAFAVWADKCWITINADNSITFVVDDTWGYDVSLGVPNHPELVSYYEPSTGKIQLYYNYLGDGGYRIFHETFIAQEMN